MNALEASGVCKSYGERNVLSDFSLSVERGGFHALMGPSGSGKSTFLHLAAGLVRCDAGRILVGGENVAAMGDGAATRFRRSHIGFVFQAYNLLPDRTVAANIELPLKLAHRRPDQERISRLCEALGIAGLTGSKAGELSGGEQQRVAIARAMAAAPDILLADEPTGNLDAATSAAVCEMLKKLNESEGCALLVVTHDPVVAASAKTVHFLKDGKVAVTHETQGDASLVSRIYLEACR